MPLESTAGLARAVLINTIIDMVLISIHPFAVRKIFLLAVALLGLSSAFCFADPVFMTRQYAPSNAELRASRSAQATVGNHYDPALGGPSFEVLSSRRSEMRLTPDLRLEDKTYIGMHSNFSEKTAVWAGMPVCWRSKAHSFFAIALPESNSTVF